MSMRAHRLALIAVWLLIVGYGVYFSAYSIQRHRAFLTNASDLGQIDQAIWNTRQGRPLEFTRRTGEQSIRLTDHVEPLFLPVALVLLVYDNVEALLILQSFVIALGALPVYWIARRRLGGSEAGDAASRPGDTASGANDGASGAVGKGEGARESAAVLFAALYLLFPGLEAANLAEFHAVTFVPVLILFAYHYGSLRRWGWFALFALLALMVKEEIALLVLTLAAYFAFLPQLERGWARVRTRVRTARAAAAQNGPRAVRMVPLALAALALAWFVLTVFVIIPAFNPQGRSPYTCRYVIGEDCPEIARGLFLTERLGYLGGLLASTGFAALLDPVSLLLGAPLILANVVSNYPAQYSGTFHYSAPVVPYFVLAAIGGAARLGRRLAGRMPPWLARAPALAATVPILLLALGYHLTAGYTPVARGYNWPATTPHNELFARFAAQIPADARVATTASLHPHLSHREYLYRYPNTGDAGYVLLDVNESDRGIPAEFRMAYDGLLRDNAFGVVDATDGYILLRRGAPSQVLPDAFYTAFRAANPAPQFAVRADFGDAVRLLGYDVLTDAYGRGSLRTYWTRLKPLNRNLYLFPFVADANGAPVPDLNFAMTVLFWYPTAAWQADEVVVARTVPVEWGERVRLGVGVTTSDTWADPDARLGVGGVAPASYPVREESWVELGEFVREGATYVRTGPR